MKGHNSAGKVRFSGLLKIMATAAFLAGASSTNANTTVSDEVLLQKLHQLMGAIEQNANPRAKAIAKTFCNARNAWISNAAEMYGCLNGLQTAGLTFVKPLEEHSAHADLKSEVSALQSIWGHYGLKNEKVVYFGEDQRRPPNYNGDEAILRSTGKMRCLKEGGYIPIQATANVVRSSLPDRDIIITAGHCLIDEDTGKKFTSCEFLPYNQSYMALEVDMDSVISGDFAADPKAWKTFDSYEDWGAAVLKKRVSGGSFGVDGFKLLNLPAEEIVASQDVRLSSYNRMADVMSVDGKRSDGSRCQVFAKPPGGLAYGRSEALIHNCHADSGSSGGALTVMHSYFENGISKKELVIVGIHRGMPSPPPDLDYPKNGDKFDLQNSANMAIRISQDILRAVSQLEMRYR